MNIRARPTLHRMFFTIIVIHNTCTSRRYEDIFREGGTVRGNTGTKSGTHNWERAQPVTKCYVWERKIDDWKNVCSHCEHANMAGSKWQSGGRVYMLTSPSWFSNKLGILLFSTDLKSNGKALEKLTQQTARNTTCGRCTNVIGSKDAPALPPPYAPPTFIFGSMTIYLFSLLKTQSKMIHYLSSQLSHARNGRSHRLLFCFSLQTETNTSQPILER